MDAVVGEEDPLTGTVVEVSEIDSERMIDSDRISHEIKNISCQVNRLFENGVSPKDICILTRTHAQLNLIKKELSDLGFPVISHGHGQFFKNREILDALGILKFLLNPWDDHNLILLLRSPWVGLSDKQLVDIIGQTRLSFWPSF